MILPEIGVALNRNHYACWGGESLEKVLPLQCPCCGAKRVKGKPKYQCGAEYKSKPQGQTHTDVYWGECPARVDPLLAANLGLAADTPPEIVADVCFEANLHEDEADIRRMIASRKKKRKAK